jgi:uncharacterized membrane protein
MSENNYNYNDQSLYKNKNSYETEDESDKDTVASSRQRIDSTTELSMSVHIDSVVDNTNDDAHRSHLTRQEIWNLTFCLLSWACTISISTLGKIIADY